MSTLVAGGQGYRTTLGQLVLGAIVGIVRVVVLWRELRAARRLLQGMPDGLLSDMGVSRGSIDHATAFGRESRKRG